MPSARVAELMAIWSQLRKGSALRLAPDENVRLGYSGCYLSNGIGERWIARDARVLHEGNAPAESRDDPLRRFELALLQSAPENTLPADIVDRSGNKPI